MRLGARMLPALLAAAALAVFRAGVLRGPPAARAESFRVDNKVFVNNEKEPRIQSTTIFHEGRVYDFLKSPGEITLFDSARHRFVLLDPARRVARAQRLDVRRAVKRRELRRAGRDAVAILGAVEPTEALAQLEHRRHARDRQRMMLAKARAPAEIAGDEQRVRPRRCRSIAATHHGISRGRARSRHHASLIYSTLLIKGSLLISGATDCTTIRRGIPSWPTRPAPRACPSS